MAWCLNLEQLTATGNQEGQTVNDNVTTKVYPVLESFRIKYFQTHHENCHLELPNISTSYF